jgi:hypothetical protein
MDIYSILASKPHNFHYLKRYISFITKCQLINVDYAGQTEGHHICPKANDMFPEYIDFKEHPWNKAELTPRQHFVAHLILWKIYPNFKSQRFAFWSMSNKMNIKKSKIYEVVHSEFCKDQSERVSGTAKYKDNEGNILTLRTDDPRVLSGEYVGHRKGAVIILSDNQKDNLQNAVTVRDPNTGECVRLRKDDPLYLSGYYVGTRHGIKSGPRSEETKAKLRIACSKPHPKLCCVECKKEITMYRFERHLATIHK